jgi:hypothetical protein
LLAEMDVYAQKPCSELPAIIVGICVGSAQAQIEAEPDERVDRAEMRRASKRRSYSERA